MKRLLASGLVLFTLAVAPFAVAAAEEKVAFGAGGSGFLVTPDGKGPFPAVIVIQEWWGLNDWVKDQARALAKEGYVALAVDLYRGKVTTKQEDAHQLMMGLPPDRAMRRPEGGVRLPGGAHGREEGPHRLHRLVHGRALLAGPRHRGTDAGGGGAPTTARPPTDAAAIARIKAPVLGNYGGDDKGPSPDQVKAFEAAMKKAGKSVDVKIYEGAGHAFANVNNPWGGYREAAAKDAWARIDGVPREEPEEVGPPSGRGHGRVRREGRFRAREAQPAEVAAAADPRPVDHGEVLEASAGFRADRAAAPSWCRRSSR